MSYTALYRKYRPLRFEDIVGQEHITKTLKNQIIAERVGHAYLFNGGRGTGKTSAAKILARAINCLEPENGEPCNKCDICKAIIEGSLTDIVELDAASNNSVEDVRLIRDEVNFLPTLAKYRVYIIDEVHMLSTGAFNALLKTLEEPPKHVKFILATTEPQKLPQTILSRCQRFDFKRILNKYIKQRLEYVCKDANIEITPEAMEVIAVLSEGALRDALSILERCIQEGTNKIEADKIRELVGIPKIEYINSIVESIVNKDVDKTLSLIDVIMDEGKDLSNLLWEIIKYLKDVLIFKTTGKIDMYNDIEIENIKKISDKCSKEQLLNMIFELSELENNMKWSSQKTIMFQVGMMKLCDLYDEKKVVNRVEENVDKHDRKTPEKGSTKTHGVGNVNEVLKKENNTNIKDVYDKESEINTNIKEVYDKKSEINNVVTQSLENEQKDDGKNNIRCWNNVISKLKENGKIMLYTNLLNARPCESNDMCIKIDFPKGLTSFGKTIIEQPENINELNRLISLEFGKSMQVKIMDNKDKNENSKKNDLESFTKNIDIPINIIDE